MKTVHGECCIPCKKIQSLEPQNPIKVCATDLWRLCQQVVGLCAQCGPPIVGQANPRRSHICAGRKVEHPMFVDHEVQLLLQMMHVEKIGFTEKLLHHVSTLQSNDLASAQIVQDVSK